MPLRSENDGVHPAASGEDARHAFLSTRWLACTRIGDTRGLRSRDVEEMFATISGSDSCTKSIEASDLRRLVTRYCSLEVCELVDNALTIAGSPPRRRIDVDGFLQAMRLNLQETHARDAHSVARYPRVDRAGLVDLLRERRAAWEGCRSVFLAVAFFALCFALPVLQGDQKSNFHIIEAVRRELPLASFESDFPAALSDWLESRVEASDVASYSRVVGGVRVRRFSTGAEPLSSSHHLVSSSSDDDTTWVLWPLRRGDARLVTSLSKARSWLAGKASASNVTTVADPLVVQISVLAHNQQVQLFVLYWLTFHVTLDGVVKLEPRISAFPSQDRWFTEEWTFHKIFGLLFVISYAAIGIWRIFRLALNLRRFGLLRGLKSQLLLTTLIDFMIVCLCVSVTSCLIHGARVTGEVRQLVQLLRSCEPTDASVPTTVRYSALQLDADIAKQGDLQGFPQYLQSLDTVTDLASRASIIFNATRWISIGVYVFAFLRVLGCLRSFHSFGTILKCVCATAFKYSRYSLLTGSSLLVAGVILHISLCAKLEVFLTFGRAIYSVVLLAFGYFPSGHVVAAQHSTLPHGLVAWYAIAGASLGPGCIVAIVSFIGFFHVCFFVTLVLDAYSESKVDRNANMLTLSQQIRNMVFQKRLRLQRLRADELKRVSRTGLSGESDSGDVSDCFDVRVVGMPSTDDDISIHGAGKAEPRWTEARLLRTLAEKEAVGQVTVESLLKESENKVGAKLPLRDELNLKALFGIAADRQHEKHFSVESARSAAHSLRLTGRVSVQLQELQASVRHLESCLRWRSEERAKISASLGEHLSHSHGDVLTKSRTPHTRSSFTSTRNCAQRMDGGEEVKRAIPPAVPPIEGPEPEPSVDGSSAVAIPKPVTSEVTATLRLEARATAATAAALDGLIDKQLREVSISQGVRHDQLEGFVHKFGSCLDPLSRLLGGTSRGALDPSRLSRLEGLTWELSQKLRPILVFDADLEATKSENKWYN
eukprot:TRINITY_DN34444_c0_g3_i1.p1 TRINITY_DN34444_c0_g3~~TRINITY_DN34444_c0_g3_i1.p1  ORF type:complete len:995 (+),score=97.97 TRINITY_DN34444_c0_g3_i1:124-3108(+)